MFKYVTVVTTFGKEVLQMNLLLQTLKMKHVTFR
jgi:hypothetical protein